MNIFFVELTGLTASYRMPDSKNFHKTCEFPTKSSIVGLIGAAIGLDFKNAHDYFYDNDVKLCVTGKHNGIYSDLWRHTKTKSELQIVKNIIRREYLYEPHFEIYISCSDLTVLNDIRDALKSPKFMLTLGNSDDIAKIVQVSDIANYESLNIYTLNNIMIKGNITNDVKLDIDLKTTPIIETVMFPSLYNLVDDFTFNDNSSRVAKGGFTNYTGIKSVIKLNEPLDGYFVNNKNIIMW